MGVFSTFKEARDAAYAEYGQALLPPSPQPPRAEPARDTGVSAAGSSRQAHKESAMFRRKPPPSLDERTRHILGSGNDGIAVRGPEPSPVVQREPQTYRVPMTCSDTGKPLFALAHINGDIIDLMDNELAAVPHRNGDCHEIPPGSYRIRVGESRWSCPHCGIAWSVWICVCKKYWGALHCGGVFEGGPYPLLNQYCACGKLDARRPYIKGSQVSAQCLLIQYPLSRNPAESDKEHVPLVVGKGGRVR